MKLINRSPWDTDDLRAWIYACAHDHQSPMRNVTVLVVTSRARHALAGAQLQFRNGHGYYKLKLAKPERFRGDAIQTLAAVADDYPLGTITAKNGGDVAHVTEWLVRSVAGFSRQRVPWGDPAPNWATGLVIRPAGETKKAQPTGVDIQRRKREDAEIKLARWQRKLKLATTKVKKLKREIIRRTRAIEKMEDA